MPPISLPQGQPLTQTLAAVYDREEQAFIAALIAVRASVLPWEQRVHLCSLLDQRLGETSNPRDAARFALTCERVARYFGRLVQ